MSASGKARVTAPAPQRRARSSERHRRGEADRVDCVRIVHKHRNLLAHAPERLHDELTADYHDMIYAESAPEIEARRKSFLRKWRLKCAAVATSLEEAGEKLFTFTRLPKSQWRSARTTNAIERLHEEFKRRIKTQTVLPSAETAAMLFWALLASGQITMRKVDGWPTLAEEIVARPVDLAA
jgi:transposase-like protein